MQINKQARNQAVQKLQVGLCVLSLSDMQTESVARAINRQQWLKPVEDGLKKGLDQAFAADTERGKPIENALHGVWLGHALHPVLTDIPLGAWTVAFALDLAETCGARRYGPGADAALNIGLVGALGAAATGITDWKEISVEARRVGLVHGVLNTIAAGLYLTSSIQRARGKRQAGRVTALAGFAVAGVSASLGGHLVYANQIGVARTSETTPPADFVPVIRLDELEEAKPRRVEHEGYPLVLVKKGDRIYALAEKCTHLGGPMSEGELDGDCLRCPWHGSAFSLEDGSVKESPATAPLAVFDARVRQGSVEVRVSRSLGADTGPAGLQK